MEKKLVDIILDNKMALSKAEAKRLILSNAVKVDKVICNDLDTTLDTNKHFEISIGKTKKYSSII